MKPYWILYTVFPHESLLNLWASKASQNSTEFLTEMSTQFFRINLYWICQHLKLVKIQQNSLVKYVDNFPARILTEFCTQSFRMNPYWIFGHLKLVKLQQNSLVKFVDNFLAWILTECEHLKPVKIQHEALLNFVHSFSAWILTEFVSI